LPIFDSILPHAPAFVVVLARIGGVFIFTPLLSSSSVPMRVRALVVVMLALALYPISNTEHLIGQPIEFWVIAPLILTEIVVGATLGLLASIPLLSVQLGGLLMGQQMGLGLAQLVNPGIDIEGDSIGQLLFIIAISTFFMMDGLTILFDALASTFYFVEPGGFALGDAPLDLILGLIASGFELAFRIAMPVLALIFIETLILGFLMKTVPTLNIMSFGFPIKIVIGLGTLVGCIYFIAEAISFEVEAGLQVMQDWAWSL
jgi:flagellar biosynthetic protein FliR